ncbi:DUF885 family protein [Amycolatopsis sp. DSM 110486]|uniref:DUF885 domain-containing protein n=1 Tax=Amycolatopsis sp. DSM 110486 TaxID=2865832 RepID=UPI001C699C5F|nr:DUF885 domain-containing protein [Amycolatopsis sp. DSM 110486]QYN19841.1 DUF885 domain-containing protein [Amycolatopsis sp. DSM 110486]
MAEVTKLADELHRTVLDRFPMSAIVQGIPGYGDRLPDYGEATESDFATTVARIADRAERLDPAELTASELVTRAVVVQQARMHSQRAEGRWTEFTVSDFILTPVPGLLLDLATLPLTMGEDLVGRLRSLPTFFETLTRRHRDGMAAGLLPVAHLVVAAVKHLDDQLADLGTLRRSAEGALGDRCDEILGEVAAPAIRAYRDVLTSELLPRGRDADHAGVCWLPGGEIRYAAAVRGHTTTGLSPDELHRIGLSLVAELGEEYVALGPAVFGTSRLSEIFARLRGDLTLRFRTGEEMLLAARDAVVRATAAAPGWFAAMPSSECEVAAYPPTSSSRVPSAYLVGSLDGARPGTYFVNTRSPADVPRHKAQVTAFHEGVPGHHFEMTLSQERTNLPLLRRTAQVTAFREGWALYAERLADEMGLYSGPLDRLGMLAMDSNRAARLVVDTGLHAKGWSRRRAVEYLLANTPMAPALIESEVDRYLSEPGQALAYMVGRREIGRLRNQARHVLGNHFDLRAFHTAVLSEGQVPLSVLDEIVTTWIGSCTPPRTESAGSPAS